jgi:aldehyde dehydrogenase (NAD+)
VSNEQLVTQIQAVFSAQQNHALALRTSTAKARMAWIQQVQQWVWDHREEIRAALLADFKKPAFETDLSEIYPVLTEARHAKRNLRDWMRTKPVDTPLTFMGTQGSIQYEPKGTSLIIAPWNYPFNLAICPLLSALAAGCTAIIKPSELTPHTSALIRGMVADLFPEHHVSVFEGGVEVSQGLLAQPFNHIFFTGSPAVGKVVMRAAAEHLTSVTLELGGKSPALIAPDANLRDAARKLAYTKLINTGQTCVAPDYVYVHAAQREALVAHLRDALQEFYMPEGRSMEESLDLGRIINERHFARLCALLDDSVQQGATIAWGGKRNPSDAYLEPTLLTGVQPEMAVMREEIFGPILPILDYTNLDQAIGYINAHEKPLALYAFSQSSKTLDFIFRQTSSGGAVANDCVLHYLHPELPFGGVNNSGLGKAHGYSGFLEFSNQKSVLKQRIGFTNVTLLYPPFTKLKEKVLCALMRWF